ncbi:MAG: hypothetical protein HOP37_02365 [Cyclobacteriaceae bacterium]|nr:hypothetical protein [Cyclobacteriaceae bacterium]
MPKLPMRYLRYSLLLMVAFSCASEYKLLQPAMLEQSCVSKIKPRGFTTSWFTTSVDVVGKHLSGLLLIKNQPDSSTRVVFTSEAGITFFDFEFTKNGTFAVKRIVSQLDKKPIIQTLRKDFELTLGIPFRGVTPEVWTMNTEKWYGVKQKNETSYFITDTECASLLRLELGSTRKKKTEVFIRGKDPHDPDSVQIKHYNFAMQIELRKLMRE